MKKYLYIYLLYFLFQEFYSYITFPLFKDIPKISIDETPPEIMTKLFDSNLYIKMNIGSENTEVKAYLSNERYELMIAGNGIRTHKYSENESISYNCTYCKEKEYSYGEYSRGIISTENFYINFNDKEIRTINKMNFVLGTAAYYMNPPEALVGLIFPRIDSEINYNIFKSLKNTNSTSSYNWYLNFTENDSKMVIDAFPHDFDNKRFNASKKDTAEAINDGYYLVWGLLFNRIYYDNEKNNISYTDNSKALIDFSVSYILAPNDTLDFFGKIFFNEYFKKNICFNKGINNDKYYFIYCQNSKDFEPNKFKNIYFKSLDLNSVFEFNYKELFFYKDNYIYFLILFQNELYWTFGELFLKKYFLVFNHDQNNLAFYQNYENKSQDKKDEKGFNYNILYISLLVLILIGIIAIFIVIYFKKGTRKKKANELNDEYEYLSKNNNDKNDYIVPPEESQ